MLSHVQRHCVLRQTIAMMGEITLTVAMIMKKMTMTGVTMSAIIMMSIMRMTLRFDATQQRIKMMLRLTMTNKHATPCWHSA